MHLAESAGEVEIKGNVKCYNKGGGESSSIGDIGINPITKYVDGLKARQ